MSAFDAGSIWWGLIDFDDGEGERKKYFVLLTACVNAGEQSCAALTTTKGDIRYRAAARAQSPCGSPKSPCFRIDAGQVDCFPATTWVQFDNAYPISRAGLEKLAKDGRAAFIQALDEQRLRTLLNCAKKSTDIALRDLARIGQALKALGQPKTPAPPGTATSAPPSSGANSPMLSTRDRIQRYCSDCRAEFVGLVGISATDLASILADSAKPPDDFMVNAEAGFELLSGCAKCLR